MFVVFAPIRRSGHPLKIEFRALRITDTKPEKRPWNEHSVFFEAKRERSGNLKTK
jgi:hypothetical protein